MRGMSRLLFVAYSLLLLKPAMPVIMDGLAHAFWNNIHVAVVHKVNGVEHVHYELLKNAKELEKEKGSVKGKVAADDAPYCAGNGTRLSFKKVTRRAPQQNIICETFYTDAVSVHDYPPPKA